MKCRPAPSLLLVPERGVEAHHAAIMKPSAKSVIISVSADGPHRMNSRRGARSSRGSPVGLLSHTAADATQPFGRFGCHR